MHKARSACQMHAPPRRDDGLRDIPCHAALEGSACKRLSGTRLHQRSCQQPETQKASPPAPFPHSQIHSGLQQNAMLLHIQFSSDAPSVTNKDSSWYVLLPRSQAQHLGRNQPCVCVNCRTALSMHSASRSRCKRCITHAQKGDGNGASCFGRNMQHLVFSIIPGPGRFGLEDAIVCIFAA